MSNEDKPFTIDLRQLKSRNKDGSPQVVQRVDAAGEGLGFVDRSAKKQRGRRPSPRTGQVHAKVLPHVAEEIGNEARRRGVQQGVVIEDAWALYVKANNPD
ncbi:hypothetical protein SAMN07250955_11099 [Arboricoccus pini]|uniref:Chromosome partitioning protein ParB n=1 Tax=Arboricoccus pini TaxID=1963835 RepID=A0A212RLQ0_9PROT|nr:chromosome partitioning protein ParB [Arboricoccus pini]SNB73272.1 hypothetical protein SAMN07250955_11099 [Arboricoccus pini]